MLFVAQEMQRSQMDVNLIKKYAIPDKEPLPKNPAVIGCHWLVELSTQLVQFLTPKQTLNVLPGQTSRVPCLTIDQLEEDGHFG